MLCGYLEGEHSGRRSSKSKGPEARQCLACQDSKGASVCHRVRAGSRGKVWSLGVALKGKCPLFG